MEIHVDPARTRNFLFGAVALLVAAHLFNKLAIPFLGHGFPILDLDGEATVPSFFSSMLLFFSAILFAFIAHLTKQTGKPFVIEWNILSVVFLFLTLDEFSEIHERITFLLKQVVETNGLLYSVWIVPYGIFVIVFGLLYLRFLRSLPSEQRSQFILAGALYILGAIGLEALGEWLSQLKAEDSPAFILCVLLEETLEMSAIVLLIHSLLRYLRSEFPGLLIKMKKD